MLERDRELGLIDALVAEALQGAARVALVEGPAGIGKTRLVEAARSAARERGFRVLVARASSL